jgi:hypothetical protein
MRPDGAETSGLPEPIKAPNRAGTAHSPSGAKAINPDRPGRRAMKTHSLRPSFFAGRVLRLMCLIPVSFSTLPVRAPVGAGGMFNVALPPKVF